MIKLKKTPKIAEQLIIAFILLLSTLVMLGWFLNYPKILSIIPGSATMKFNSALLFFLSSFCVIKSKKKKHPLILLFFTLLVLIISFLTLIENLFDINLFIDNLFVEDIYSSKNPGRMSTATALCFFLFSLSLLGLRSDKTKKGSQNIVYFIIIIAFISTVTFILDIPAEYKTDFYKTMAIHTSILFLLISSLLASKTPNLGFTRVLIGKQSGSNLLRKLLPFVILIPFLLSYFLLSLLNKNAIEINFGIVLYTVILISISVTYTSIISIGLNKSDTERKKLENNIILRNQELMQFKEALDRIAIVSISDNKGIIKYVNNKFCEISKWSREEIIGNTYEITSSNHHSKDFIEKISEINDSNNTWIGEIKNKTKDGKLYWTETAVIPLKDKLGNNFEYMAIKQDITERKENEELLASKYVKQLETKNKELEQFAYIASHDLQEPLRTITSFCNILYTEYNEKLDEQAKISFRFIRQATGRMSSLIKALLDYSRLGYEEELILIDCNIVIKDIIEDLNTTIKQTNTKIEFKKLPKISGYKTGVRLLLQNLITNAIKFRKKDTDCIIKINAIKKENFIEFSVEDNGIGIAKEYQKKIFAIFQRLHLKNEYEGTGIGLAHCQKIVNLHGGEIWVESSLNNGSKFYFTILNEKEKK
ncbi:ATP-binding protein [Polaribacter sp. 20A6]|uniref:sensor histidine kinase n=1 Tax=Polaribacter sp. 20A6 TaxID=2687289 RepID=UPI0013FDDB08|nr:ATP-binding protein [Polaribacter sp. 20A6]